MASIYPDHYAVLDTIEGFTGAGPTQVPTCLSLVKHHPIYTDFSFMASPVAFEQHLKQHEQEAHNKYCSALEDMRDVLLSPWFARLLKTKIIPALERIGFDASLGWALFKMATPAWELMGRMIDKMKADQEKAFPVVNAFDLARGGHNDWGRFLITLRQGCPGIEAVMHYFGIDAGFLNYTTNGRLRYAEVPAALNGLFQSIKNKFLSTIHW